LYKFSDAIARAAADKKAARDQRTLQRAQDAEAAGTLITSGTLGDVTVEVYSGGYVRVGSQPSSTSQPKLSDISLRPPGSVSKNTPYEKLRSIVFTPSAQDRAAGSNAALEKAVGPAVTSLLKGGKNLMKGTAPGLAAAGAAHLMGAEGRKTFLTITTDKQIHTLVSTSKGGQADVGLALEAAGQSVLGGDDVTAPGPGSLPRLTAEQSTAAPEAAAVHADAQPTLPSRLRDLAELHKDGVLSDEEFSSAKAKLLDSL